ncbi:Crp/Fnr family transcriptional regulator [Tropicimonas marinistellae]|uniref:Crp/Fnr family transcriptional regulator n=1 Tax=Tropicimonas marinistellae TaxID=1739787 RepID=UPI00082DC421|nr:Crp/Fnr family transcriptional regulator [Tropicimonas marinistellae]
MVNPPLNDVFAAAWLQGVSDRVLGEFAALGDEVSFADKSVVYAQDAEQTCLWGVISGQVRVMVTLNELETILGHIHHAGAWLGESEPVLSLPGLVEMRSSGETTLVRILYARFRALANRHPELWEALARLASMNQLLAMSAANDLALRTGRQRIAATLLRLGGHRGVLQRSATTRTISITQQELSDLANLAPSKVSPHLKFLEGKNLIRLGYGKVTITDIDGLSSSIDG